MEEMKTVTSKNCYTVIDRDRYEYDDMMNKRGRIDDTEYSILTKMMD